MALRFLPLRPALALAALAFLPATGLRADPEYPRMGPDIYDIHADGTLANKRFFAPVAADGVTMDNDGNLYFCENAVLVYDPAGKKIGTIEVPAQPTNVCFGGRDAHTLFITTRPALYSLKMRIGGTAKSNRAVSAKS